MREQCSAAVGRRRCLKLAQAGSSTCRWHEAREHLHTLPQVDGGLLVDVDSSRVGDVGPLIGIMTRILIDAEFRCIVGLPRATYVLVELRPQLVDVIAQP